MKKPLFAKIAAALLLMPLAHRRQRFSSTHPLDVRPRCPKQYTARYRKAVHTTGNCTRSEGL